MHIEFDPQSVDWSQFIEPKEFPPSLNQIGGSGGGGYQVFTGIPYQRGAGIGSLFRSIFMRYLLPLGKQAGVAIGRQSLDSGSKILSSVLEGKDLKESLIDEGKSGLKNLLEKAASNLEKKKQNGQGFDFKKYKNLANKPNYINKNNDSVKDLKTKTSGLRSLVGPPIIPSVSRIATKRRGRIPTVKLNNSKKQNKRLRVDSLGVY